jgi:hypothetical protein
MSGNSYKPAGQLRLTTIRPKRAHDFVLIAGEINPRGVKPERKFQPNAPYRRKLIWRLTIKPARKQDELRQRSREQPRAFLNSCVCPSDLNPRRVTL